LEQRKTNERRKKISLKCKGSHKANSTSFKKGQKPPHTGKTAEWAKGKNNVNFGKFGKEHPCFKKTKVHKFHKIIRETFKYRQWRSDIFTRDNFTCVICGLRGVYLEADHIKRFIDIIREYKIETLDEAIGCEELWNINNGRTLCQQCHRKTDTWGKRSYKIFSD
jgi:hypothetical protein